MPQRSARRTARRRFDARGAPLGRREALGLCALLGWQWLAYRMSAGHYRRLPIVPRGESAAGSVPISVIVPARDEARLLPGLLRSLSLQREPAAEVIVVDDGSSDGTAALAADAGATVLGLAGPPPGWTGKNHACHRGSERASGDWLLFLDADVTLGPDALGAALRFATERGLDGVSLFLQQRCETRWERLLLPYAYAHYFAGARPSEPLANGQFILIRADAYRRMGGHAAVRGSVIDDIALARRCRDRGVQLAIARGEHLGAVRMYTGLGHIWEGFGKNAFRFVAADPVGGAATIAVSVAATSIAQVGWRAWRLGGLARWSAALGSYALTVRGLAYWTRLFRAGPGVGLFYPLSSVVFMAIAIDSLGRVLLRRGAIWKGRAIR